MKLAKATQLNHSLSLNAARWLSAFVAGALCTACPAAEPACGDAVVDATEECDDGNAFAGDGCDAQCVLEEGYACLGDEACTAIPVCGDGILTSNEWCDDGELNGTGYNQCTPQCTLGPYCGDGVVDSEFEDCDDGTNNGQGSNPCLPGCARP